MEWNRTDRAGERESTDPPGVNGLDLGIAVSSRRSGFERVRAGILDDCRSAILLTGERGAGKTWLWDRVARSLTPDWRTLTVDMTSSLSATEFLLLVGHGLGLEAAPNLAAARVQVAEALRDEAEDGRPWILVLEDAHSTPPPVWEEIRVVSNHLGEPGGFAALVIVAQTELLRRLEGRGLASAAGRIAEHVHLAPLDLDECRAMVQGAGSGGRPSADLDRLEEIHRDARGNAGEILRLVRRRSDGGPSQAPGSSRSIPHSVAPRARDRETIGIAPAARATRPIEAVGESSIPEPSGPVRTAEAARPGPASRSGLSLIPSRPPLRLEEGLIEVGWRGDDAPALTAEPDEESGPTLEESEVLSRIADLEDASPMVWPGPAEIGVAETSAPRASNDEPGEEWVDDPYAALQAWSEWAKNRQSSPGGEAEPPGVSRDPEEDESDNSKVGSVVRATIRAEAQHEFSPFGQLFGEVRRSKQP